MITFGNKLKKTEAELLQLQTTFAAMELENGNLKTTIKDLTQTVADLQSQLNGDTLVAENAELQKQVSALQIEAQTEAINIDELVSAKALEVAQSQGIPAIAVEGSEAPGAKVDVLSEMAALPANLRFAFFQKHAAEIKAALGYNQ